MELWMIVLLVLVGVILVFFLVASGIRFYANSITTWFNIRKIRFEGTISDHTRALLDMNGLADVQVRTTGFFSSMFVGNTYKVSTKTVRLSWLTSRRATPTNLAIACKLVALAKLHRENVSGLGSVAVNRWTSGLPILFLPLIVVGLIIDLISSGGIGIVTLIFSVFAFVILLVSLIISIVSVRVECKALDEGDYGEAIDIIDKTIASKANVSSFVYEDACAQRVSLLMLSGCFEEGKKEYIDLPLEVKKHIASMSTPAAVRAYILVSGLVDESKGELENALGRVNAVLKKGSEETRESDTRLIKKAIKQVLEAHKDWDMSGYNLNLEEGEAAKEAAPAETEEKAPEAEAAEPDAKEAGPKAGEAESKPEEKDEKAE